MDARAVPVHLRSGVAVRGRAASMTESCWDRRLLDYARLCAEDGLSPLFYERLADMLNEDWPAVLAVLRYDPAGFLASRRAVRGVPASEWGRYESYYARLNPFPRLVREHRLENSTGALSRLLPERELLASEYYEDFLKGMGRHVLALSIELPSLGRTSVSFFRKTPEGGEFGEEEARRLEALRPFLRTALLLQALVAERERDGKAPVPGPEARERLRARFGLTEMQAVVAVALLDGLSYRDIADEFAISPNTVHTHVKAILGKAGARSARELSALVRWS